MKIGMIVAMDKEYKQLRPLFPENKLILQKSGIATVNAAIQAVEMIRQYKPDCRRHDRLWTSTRTSRPLSG